MAVDVQQPQRSGWRERRHRGLFWAGVLGCAALVAGGAVYAYDGYRNGGGADGAVRGYLHALASDDAPAALSYGQIPAGSQAFLTSQVLATQLKLAPIHNISIGADTAVGGDTKVAFGYDLAFARGTQHVSDTVLVRKVGDRWRLDRVATPVQLTLLSAPDRATLAGAAIPSTPTLLFPGAVPIDFDTPYLRLALASDQLPLSHGTDVALDVELTPAARSAVVAQLTSMLTVCGQGGTGASAVRCPVPNAEFVPGSMSGTLKIEASSVNLVLDSSAAGMLSITGAADFDGKYRVLDFSNVAHSRQGKVTVPFQADAFAVAPLAVSFEVQS